MFVQISLQSAASATHPAPPKSKTLTRPWPWRAHGDARLQNLRCSTPLSTTATFQHSSFHYTSLRRVFTRLSAAAVDIRSLSRPTSSILPRSFATMAAQVHHGPIRIDGNPLKSKQRVSNSPLRRSSSGILSPTSPPSPRTVTEWQTPDVTGPHFGRRTERTPPINYGPEQEQQVDAHAFELPSAQSLVDLSRLRGWDSNAVSTGLSLDTKLATTDRDDFHFPRYDSVAFGCDDGEDAQIDNYEPEPSTTTDTTRSDSPLPTPTVSDDTAVKQEPSQHVDYLSHNWREEDIWASWKHIVSQRKVYGQRSRLENASWRTWTKSKNRLRTVPPEKLNWYVASSLVLMFTCPFSSS